MKTERRRHPDTGRVCTYERTIKRVSDNDGVEEFNESDWLTWEIVEDEPEPQPVEYLHDDRFAVCRIEFDESNGELGFHQPWTDPPHSLVLSTAINGGPGWRYRGFVVTDDYRVRAGSPTPRIAIGTPVLDQLDKVIWGVPDRVVFERVEGADD